MPLLAIQTAYPANFLRTTPYCTTDAFPPPHDWWVPINMEQVRPKFPPFNYGNTPYSTVPMHQPTYETIHTPMTLSTSHTADGNIYHPPWPLPHDYLSGYSAFSHSDPKPVLLGPDRSGYLCRILCLAGPYRRLPIVPTTSDPDHHHCTALETHIVYPYPHPWLKTRTYTDHHKHLLLQVVGLCLLLLAMEWEITDKTEFFYYCTGGCGNCIDFLKKIIL